MIKYKFYLKGYKMVKDISQKVKYKHEEMGNRKGYKSGASVKEIDPKSSS